MYTKNKQYLTQFPDCTLLDNQFNNSVFTLDSYISSDINDLMNMRYLISDKLITEIELDLKVFKEFELVATTTIGVDALATTTIGVDQKITKFNHYKRILRKKVSLYWVWQSSFQMIYINGFLPLIENGLYISDSIEKTDIEFVFYPSEIRSLDKINIQVTGEHFQKSNPKFYANLGFVLDYTARQFCYPYFCQLIDMFDKKYDPLFEVSSNLNIPDIFCGFVHSNPNCQTRNNFFKFLCTYKKVNSYGKLMNNMNKIEDIDWAGGDQIKLLSKHKFILCFENSRDDNDYYITEKIMNAKISGAVPIYWGTKKCLDLFEKDAFLFLEDGSTQSYFKLLHEIKELDQDNQKYLEMRNKNLIQKSKIEFMRNSHLKTLLNL
jgi:hypothetical protein